MTLPESEIPHLDVVKPPKPDVVQVIPASGVMPLKTWDDWRAMFHQIAPVIVTALVSVHLVSEADVALWLPYIVAVADVLLSIGNAQDKARRIVYALLAVLQAGSGVTMLVETVAQSSSPVVAPIVMAAGAAINGILANFFTPTSTMKPGIRIGPKVNDIAA